MKDPLGNPRSQDSTLTLVNMLQSLGVDVQCIMQNAGNHAFMCLLGFQLLIDGENTKIPVVRGTNAAPGMIKHNSWAPGSVPTIAFNPSLPIPMVTPYGVVPAPSPVMFPGLSPDMLMERDSNPSSRRNSSYVPSGGERQRKLSSGLSPDPQLRSRKESTASPIDIVGRMGNMRMAST